MRHDLPKIVLLLCVICTPSIIMAQEESTDESIQSESNEIQPSREFVRLLWDASSRSDFDRLNTLVTQCLKYYESEAKLQQSQLDSFPPRGFEKDFTSLNDVATCLFIQAEATMHQGQNEKAIAQFQRIIDDFGYAQAWDPRGWYWSVAEKSQASIRGMKGETETEADVGEIKKNKTVPELHFKGIEKIVDYTKYGTFHNVGKENYRYIINSDSLVDLAKAVGEGIYPNTSSIYNNPRFKIVQEEGRLKGSHWDFTKTDDLEAAYFKWATAREPWGVKLFYLGEVFEKAGMYFEALRAYHALIVHFPKSVAWTNWQTPWYPGQAAISKIRYILRQHPELNYVDKWMKIQIRNGYDNDVNNDVIITFPGKIIEKGLINRVKDSMQWDEKVELGAVKRTLGEGTVHLVQYENGHWQLLVNGQPYVVKGMTYEPTKVGQSPDKGTLENWMEEDTNGNGLPDGPFDTWVDKNKNNKQDADEPVVGDFQLMKEMGVNTIRLYHHPRPPKKEILRKLFNDYGIRVILGDFLGKYTVGSGATWAEGTDYENEEHKKNMMESVKKMVMEHKDEPYILMWLLGNENNYGVASNADKKPAAYFEFVNEVAAWIKSVDSNHPIAVNNGDALYLDIFAEKAPNVDVFSANVYRGYYGFGSFWEQVFDTTGKPAFITEYGCPAFGKNLTPEEADKAQAGYHEGNWLDIEDNLAGSARGMGNAIGGVVFEWTDEWWKNYEPYMQDRQSDAVGPFPGGYYYEEWFGITSQGDGKYSPFMRQLRESYFLYKRLWNK